ncbi:hypothetical protein DCS_00876 [Drechmeria coniospora]|uniref:Uncharacterized protein n=1 Tax=Drechmeria coniospora TaxID=98403 RepID=A0A151GRV9_DRECN|nr:hypothetical protein DCS_00876 [Drechmeria coniospora]KYK59742.1 hypothetical protein DCS_00876 [Drechmeria coniospora]
MSPQEPLPAPNNLLAMASRDAEAIMAAEAGNAPRARNNAENCDLQQAYLVVILILRGAEHDTSVERHAGLMFSPLEFGLNCYFEMINGSHFLAHFAEMSDEPSDRAGRLSDVTVGITTPMTEAQLVQVVESAPTMPDDMEFTNLHWVEGALDAMVQAGYVDQQAKERGFNNMLEAILHRCEDEIFTATV